MLLYISKKRRQTNRWESECTLFGFGADASSNTRQLTKNANNKERQPKPTNHIHLFRHGQNHISQQANHHRLYAKPRPNTHK